ncbi:hypothetical protein Q1695_010010 [Nippostrongylus brasiliensis]|nr:hypothetical protein Q1695_010010 [Nippostrongylus brasiliensis]
MLLKVALVALVFVAVYGQDIDKPEDSVANRPVARPRRGVAEELMKNLDSMARPLGPTNGVSVDLPRKLVRSYRNWNKS